MRPIVSGGIIGSVLLLTVGQEVMKPSAAGPLTPYVQTSTNGAYADWLDGHVGVRGTTLIARRIAQSRVMYLQTKTAAESQGHERMLALIATIPKDGRTLLGADKELKTLIDGRVASQKAEEVVRDTGPVFEVIVKFPMWGSESLIDLVLGEPGPRRIVPEVTTAGVPANPGPHSSEGPTGLIVDARGLDGAVAALLPRILDDEGGLIHGIDSADAAAVREHGLVAYATASHGVDPLSAGRRQGDRPMMVKAVAATGVTGADLVIGQTDADRIAAAATAPVFLKECRVIILMSPPPPQKPHVAPGRVAQPQRKPRAIDPNLN